jgi:hypothetical protein
MSSPPAVPEGSPADRCADLRAAVTERCREAHEAKAAHAASVSHQRELRRDLVAAQHRHAEAIEAADPGLRRAEKAAARDTYQLSRRTAQDEAEVREATAVWARALDHINREARLSQRAVQQAAATMAGIAASLQAAERAEGAARIRAEQAEATCIDARVRLAACEEATRAPAAHATATPDGPSAPTSGQVAGLRIVERSSPLVIESMVSGDRRALELAAVEVAAHTGSSPAEAQLQLQELVDAIISVAAEEGFLIFDTDHPFWALLSSEEARDVVAALARLGFAFAPTEGWHAGRVPTPPDLSMALAYAGLDARNMRDLPSAEDLQLLPRSIGVDARAFLAAQAPGLAVDQLAAALGRRAERLELLWNEWGQVRPVLLSDRHDLGSLPG